MIAEQDYLKAKEIVKAYEYQEGLDKQFDFYNVSVGDFITRETKAKVFTVGKQYEVLEKQDNYHSWLVKVTDDEGSKRWVTDAAKNWSFR